MDIKKIVLPILGVGTVVASALFLRGNSKTASNVAKIAAEAVIVPEETYGGVPMSKLNELAKTVYHGVKVTVDKWGFLVLHYTSNSGKTRFHPQIEINELGKLVNLGGHYPGQWWSSADEFVKKANELFTFKK